MFHHLGLLLYQRATYLHNFQRASLNPTREFICKVNLESYKEVASAVVGE